ASRGSVGSRSPGRNAPALICSRTSSAICLYLAPATGSPSSERTYEYSHLDRSCHPNHWYDSFHLWVRPPMTVPGEDFGTSACSPGRRRTGPRPEFHHHDRWVNSPVPASWLPLRSREASSPQGGPP